MNNKKETGWYEPEQVPVQEGIYKRRMNDGSDSIYFSYWHPGDYFEKSFWGCVAFTVELALAGKDIPSCEQSLPWCGLTEQAK